MATSPLSLCSVDLHLLLDDENGDVMSSLI